MLVAVFGRTVDLRRSLIYGRAGDERGVKGRFGGSAAPQALGWPSSIAHFCKQYFGLHGAAPPSILPVCVPGIGERFNDTLGMPLRCTRVAFS